MENIINKEQYYIVRCDRAGVFAGHIKSREGREVVLTDVRRLWYWDGAASLSQMAVNYRASVVCQEEKAKKLKNL